MGHSEAASGPDVARGPELKYEHCNAVEYFNKLSVLMNFFPPDIIQKNVGLKLGCILKLY